MFKWFGKINFTPYTKVSEFANFLKDGKLMGSKCNICGEISFPPRADCLNCMSDDFGWMEYTGKGTLQTFTRIFAAPTGFDDMAPYTIGVLDLDEGGRLLAWIEDLEEEEIKVGMKLKAVPRIFEEIEEIKVYYALERV